MIEVLKIVFMVVGIIGILGLFAFSLCWAANQAESLKGEDDYSDERPILKVTVLKEEVDNDNEYENESMR